MPYIHINTPGVKIGEWRRNAQCAASPAPGLAGEANPGAGLASPS